jgi:YaiO family outer membrane protein
MKNYSSPLYIFYRIRVKLISLLALTLFVSMAGNLQAQQLSSDELLKQAIYETNVSKDYAKAILLARKGLTTSPDYIDIHLLLGRLYMLTGKPADDTARAEFLYVLKISPDNIDALNYLITIEIIQNNNVLALQYTDKALKLQPGSKELLLKKINLLDQSGQVGAAYSLVKPLLAKYPEDLKLKEMEKDLYIRSRQNRMGLSYNYTHFEKDGKAPWSLYSAYYIREENFGTFLGRVNYANRFYDKGWQFEVEGYPKHGKQNYSFFNLAYSPAAIFPKYRAAYSYFATFPKGWEGEVGARYQYNNRSFVSYAASIGKYIGNYWFNLRTFITPDSGRMSQSYTITSRYYLATRDDYYTVIAGTGASPDDRSRNFQFSDRVKLHSAHITIGFQHRIWKGDILGILGTWNNQEYVAGRRENEFDMFINFQHRF